MPTCPHPEPSISKQQIKNTRAASRRPTELHRGTPDESVIPLTQDFLSRRRRSFNPLPHPCPQMSQTSRLRETGHSIIKEDPCLFLALAESPRRKGKPVSLSKSDTSLETPLLLVFVFGKYYCERQPFRRPCTTEHTRVMAPRYTCCQTRQSSSPDTCQFATSFYLADTQLSNVATADYCKDFCNVTHTTHIAFWWCFSLCSESSPDPLWWALEL